MSAEEQGEIAAVVAAEHEQSDSEPRQAVCWRLVDFGEEKGKGMRATRAISRGELLYSDPALPLFIQTEGCAREIDEAMGFQQDSSSDDDSDAESDYSTDDRDDANNEEEQLEDWWRRRVTRSELDLFAQAFPMNCSDKMPPSMRMMRKYNFVRKQFAHLRQGLLDEVRVNPTERQKFLDAHDSFAHVLGRQTVLGTWQTNAMAISPDQSDFLPKGAMPAVMCPLVARLNHSCSPNVLHHWDAAKKEMRVVAARDIEPGDELCTSYCELRQTKEDRQDFLREFYGFTCACSSCSLDSSDEEALNGGAGELSDIRRERIQELSAQVFADENEMCGRGPAHNTRRPAAAHQRSTERAVTELIRLLKEEALFCPVFEYRCNSALFESAVRHKDREQAFLIAEKCAKALGSYMGSDETEVRIWRRRAIDEEYLVQHPLWGQKKERQSKTTRESGSFEESSRRGRKKDYGRRTKGNDRL
ncbi:unnamed protein product [Amoebophrya sp. A120]|nr:unnamed protein product [Amoebophrya sp. A120]|eukprot:GSA120T00011484001.1